MNETLFSTRDFVEAWSRSSGYRFRPIAIPVSGSGPPRVMYGVETSDRYGLRSISLGPSGLYASPGWEGQIRTIHVERNNRSIERNAYKGFHVECTFQSRAFGRWPCLIRVSVPAVSYSSASLRARL